MRTQERLSGKPGVSIMPMPWRRILLLVFMILIVTAAIAVLMYNPGMKTPSPQPSPYMTGVQR